LYTGCLYEVVASEGETDPQIGMFTVTRPIFTEATVIKFCTHVGHIKLVVMR